MMRTLNFLSYQMTIMLFCTCLIASPIFAQKYPQISSAQRLKMLEPPADGVAHMVLDTDTYNEIDDQFALVYAMLSPERLKVEAVYAAPFKNARADTPAEGMAKSYDEILTILEKLDIPSEGMVFKGSTDYLKNRERPEASPAALDLVAKAKKYSPDQPLYVVAVGAITNVASAILLDPEIIKNIVVVWLGGNGHQWNNQREFNYMQDLRASQVIFDSGVPFVQVPCTPVVTHFATTAPEMEKWVGGRGAIGDYLLKTFLDYHKDHFGWSKVIWDMTAVAWVINASWMPSNIVHTPIATDNYTLSFDDSRSFMRYVYFVHRDPIFRDFFTKLDKDAN